MKNKVNGITLLQMIKDGKIKDNTLIEVSGGFRTHYPYVRFGENKVLYWVEEDKTINSVVLTDDILEYEFEIIEEIEKPKEIDKFEKIDVHYDNPMNTMSYVKKEYDYTKENICEKINEVIDKLNYLLKKEEK